MTTKLYIAASVACVLSASATTLAIAGDREKLSGKALFEFHGCVNCHGAEGKNPVTKKVPEIGGKDADFIYAEALKILSGERETDEAKLMHSALSYQSSCDYPPTNTEIRKIGEWLAAQ